ncbi:MAG: NAD(P)-dependent glycerol-3-phosphate dehydrogenase [Lachnospiraceae bacterium]|nr:NAD(P)-dependent glycerol-3-phosphate dehydrogenase [Lachnospiraceae bacterium]
MKKVTVLGGGTWGIALTILLAGNGHEVTIWSKFPAETDALAADRSKIKNLPGAVLPDSVKLTNDLTVAAENGADLIVNTVISPFVREVSKALSPYVKEGTVIVNASKGIENGTLYTMTDIISQEIPQAKVAVISGPSHAEEVSRHIPTTVVAGAADKETALYIQDMFMNQYFRVYTSPDVMGIELGGALKNVIALAAGAIDGLGYGDNTKAALITRGIVEIARLGEAMGARYETFAGLSGIGDLIVTCTSVHSRNHNAGFLLGKGKSLEEAKKEVGQVVEGVNSAQAALALAKKHGVEMPIVEQVNAVLFDGKEAKEALTELLVRERITEYSSLNWE